MWIWDSRTHQFITQKALLHSKKSFRDIVNLYPEFFIFGIESPDRIFKDTTNHYYNCTPNEFGYNSGSIISRIEYLVDLCDEMILNPNKIILIKKLQPYIVSMLDTPLKSFIYTLGALTHYISDLHQPFHTDGKYTGLDETTVHKIFEADTRQHLNDLKITLKRRKRIKNIKKEFTTILYEINKFYRPLFNNYYLKSGKVRKDRWDKSIPITEKCISGAIQANSNIFLRFEKINKIFKLQINRIKIERKIFNKLNKRNNYKLRYYSSGSILLKNIK
jgi:hypothetical protein